MMINKNEKKSERLSLDDVDKFDIEKVQLR